MLDAITIAARVRQVADQVSDSLFEGRLGALVPIDKIHRRFLDLLLNVGIPFNRWLGLRLEEFTPARVTVVSPATVLRRNHVGTAHACAQALIGEYAAGLLVAQHYALSEYRMIIGELAIEYKRAGRGILRGTAEAPAEWPAVGAEDIWVPMETRITDEAGREVAICRTRWQVKAWDKVRSKG